MHLLFFQWIDFTTEENFEDQCLQVTEALNSLIGPGSGPERWVILASSAFTQC